MTEMHSKAVKKRYIEEDEDDFDLNSDKLSEDQSKHLQAQAKLLQMYADQKQQKSNDKERSIDPKWNNLLLQSDENRKSRSTDEGDVGSTRQSRRSADKSSKKKVGDLSFQELYCGKRSEEQSGETKQDWIKVTYGRHTKRIYKAPQDVNELKIFIWNRFGALKNNVVDPGNLQLFAQLPMSEEAHDEDGSGKNGDKSAEASEMPILESEDLVSFTLQTYAECKVCPRLIVRIDHSLERRQSKRGTAAES